MTFTTDAPAPANATPSWSGDRPPRRPGPFEPRDPRRAARRRIPLLSRRGRGLLLHAALLSVGTLYLLPLLYMVARALSTWEVSVGSALDGDLTLDHFRELNRRLNIGRLAFNTTVVTVARVGIQVVLSVTAGFAIAQIRFVGNRFAFITLLSCLMVPFPLMLIPLVLMIRVAGFYNSFVGLVAPTLVSGVGVLLFVQIFRRLPPDLVDAARVDGCAPWRVLWHVAIPCSRSAIGAFATLVAIYSWNEFLWANVSTTGADRQVLTVGVTKLADQYGWSDPGVQMAAACVVTIPIIALTVALRRLTRVSFRSPAERLGIDRQPRT